MTKSKINQSIDLFDQRGLSHLQDRWKNTILQIQNNAKSLNKSIDRRDDAMAMSEWIKSDTIKTPSSLIAPPLMRFGSLTINRSIHKDKIDIPLLLSTNVNAVMVNIEAESEKVPGLFQNLILRLLLSMRMDLVKTSIIDMDFGSSFPIISAITNPMFKSNIIYRQEDITKLLTELAKEINDAHRVFLGRHTDIDSYNSCAVEMAQPYHFVFIDDFPSGFTSQSIDELLRLIDNGNAFKAGIRIFINYSNSNPSPREFDIKRFANCCSWININTDGRFSFDNWNFKYPSCTIPKLDLTVTDKAPEYIDFINEVKPKAISYSLDGWIGELKKENLIWKGNVSDGIKIPIGYITPTKTFDFYMANDNDGNCNDFFALIAGRPGYGKTVLLHNIIVNAAMKYSPDELCFYLADFAEGASFYMYRDLPHVKALMLSNNKEYALRMLEDLVLEAKRRSDCYKKAQKQFGRQVTNLSTYREISGDAMPRIVFIMDEFHTLFLSTDNITIKAKEELCNGIRQWRKFGISIILCTQSINGVNFGNADTQITYRLALNLLEMDSKSVIRNDAAKTLTRKGQTIMNNTADGRADMNVEFQSAFSPHYLDHVKYLSKLYTDKYKKTHSPFICEDGTDADIADNPQLLSLLENGSANINTQICNVFVGKPDLLRKNHTRICYRRQQGSNTLVIGEDYRTLIYDIVMQLIQLKEQSHINSDFYAVNCFNPGDTFFEALNGMKNWSDRLHIGQSSDISEYINTVFDEMERRKEYQKNGGFTEERIVLTILNAQNCYDLRPKPGKFGPEQSDVTKKLVTLLSEGAVLGIHCIIHGLSYETLFKTNGILENKHFSMFENLIFLKGADIGNMYLSGLKIGAPEQVGQMIVINAKIDGEPYEQCNAYSEISCKKQNSTIHLVCDLFEKYRYA